MPSKSISTAAPAARRASSLATRSTASMTTKTWRDVGLLDRRHRRSAPVMQHVTAACHHCLEPACMIACPVNAYEKDPVTGIVKHLDDQCFGCQYCTLACPYEVPKYQPGKGIVRKCDMCFDPAGGGRAAGVRAGLPARGDRDPRGRAASRSWRRARPLSSCRRRPIPQITLPTTTYKTRSRSRAICCRPTTLASTRSTRTGRWW